MQPHIRVPFFSIVIPTYNRANLLTRAVESVLAQTFNNWELLIVDDGSTDNTRAVVEEYADERIHYIYQQNAERSAARNNGIEHSSGKYVCFLDSDDYYLANRLQLLYDELNKRNLPVAMFYTGLVLSDNGKLSNRPENNAGVENVYDRIALSVIHSQQACISTEILRDYKYNKRFRISEDAELWLRIAEKYPVIFLPDNYTVVTVEHEERTVNVARYNNTADYWNTLSHIFSSSHPGRKISPSIKAAMTSTCFYGAAKFYIYNNRRVSAIASMLRTIASDLHSKQLKFRVNILLKLVTFTPMSKVQEFIRF